MDRTNDTNKIIIGFFSRLIPSIIIILFFSLVANAQTRAKRIADYDTKHWRYEIEVLRTGVQGTYLIEVWSYSKNPRIAIEQSKKNAIHGIIFKGFPGKPGIAGNSPLTNNLSLEDERADFFEPFFSDGGKYLKFVTITNDSDIADGDVMKIGKEYKIGVVVSVDVSGLRKDLENAGIIKSLSSGF